MENLKKQIAKNIKELEDLIKDGEDKVKIEELRKELDILLEKFLKDM